MKAKTRGRPPKRKGERLSKNRTFRVRGALDDLLQAASDASGRSVSEEVEYRLDRTFVEDVVRAQIGSGQDNANLNRLLQVALVLAGNWKGDAKRSEALRIAINYIVARYAGLPLPPPQTSSERISTGGLTAAQRIAATLVGPAATENEISGQVIADFVLTQEGLEGILKDPDKGESK